jgi:hypothetical protein
MKLATTRDATEPRWLLLIHQIPPKPDYLRVKIGRRLQRVGAVPVKNSVYVLPNNGQSFEDLQWIASEITDSGGDASICRADFIDSLTSDQIEHLFRVARNEEFAEIEAAARELWIAARRRGGEARRPHGKGIAEELGRLRKRLTATIAIDFFDAPARPMAEEALALVDAELAPKRLTTRRASGRLERAAYRGRLWVTRQGIFVDRMASAWLIRRFIDPAARFKFVSADDSRVAKQGVRFDMFGGDFTHEGDQCTFETLLQRFGLEDLALAEIAQIVHEIDLRDGKFERDDVCGIERVLAGIAEAHPDDESRLERGIALFDDLYALEAARSPSAARTSGS